MGCSPGSTRGRQEAAGRRGQRPSLRLPRGTQRRLGEQGGGQVESPQRGGVSWFARERRVTSSGKGHPPGSAGPVSKRRNGKACVRQTFGACVQRGPSIGRRDGPTPCSLAMPPPSLGRWEPLCPAPLAWPLPEQPPSPAGRWPQVSPLCCSLCLDTFVQSSALPSGLAGKTWGPVSPAPRVRMALSTPVQPTCILREVHLFGTG